MGLPSGVCAIIKSRICTGVRVTIGTALLSCISSVLLLSLPGSHSGASAEATLSTSIPAAKPSLEKELLDLLNRDRSEQELPPLVLDPALSQIARHHSQQMAHQRVVSHDLPASGNLETRLKRAGYLHRTARENVASAPTVEQVQAALMKSPSHRRNLLATDITHVGLGVVLGSSPHDRNLYVTQIFASPLKRLQADKILQSYLRRLEETRHQSGCAPLRRDSTLDRVATKALGEMANPAGNDAAKHLARVAVARVPQAEMGALSSIAADVQLIRDESGPPISQSLRDAGAKVLGAAARQALDEQGRPVIVILCLVGLK